MTAREHSAGQPVRVNVIMVHFDAADWCHSSVDSILKSRGISVSVTVVDNSANLLGLPSAVTVLTPPKNLGFAGGANYGLAGWLSDPHAGDYAVVVSHDLHVGPDTLGLLARVADEQPAFGILGPRFDSYGAVGQRLEDGEASSTRVDRHEWISGACMLVRRAAIDAIGPFDERFGSYVEDVDLCLRASDAGWQIGRVTDAVANGRGTAFRGAATLMYANQVMLRWKRRGAWAATKAVVSLPLLAARGYVRAAAPTLPIEQRRKEFSRATARLKAVPLAFRRLRDFRPRWPATGPSPDAHESAGRSHP
jgi:hypothetical protein